MGLAPMACTHPDASSPLPGKSGGNQRAPLTHIWNGSIRHLLSLSPCAYEKTRHRKYTCSGEASSKKKAKRELSPSRSLIASSNATPS